MCPSVVVYAVDHIVAPSPSNNTRKIFFLICAWNYYVSYTLVCVHFIVCSMYVSSCSTPSFSSPANSAIPSIGMHLDCVASRLTRMQKAHRRARAGVSSGIVQSGAAIGQEIGQWNRWPSRARTRRSLISRSRAADLTTGARTTMPRSRKPTGRTHGSRLWWTDDDDDVQWLRARFTNAS